MNLLLHETLYCYVSEYDTHIHICICMYVYIYIYRHVGPVAQSVWRLITGWTVRDLLPVGARFSARPDQPWVPRSLL